jgi:hypothetical protein
MHVDCHAIVTASKIVSRRAQNVDSYIACSWAETVANESVTSAIDDDESLPAHSVESHEFQG